jgi:hypothetical protein
VFDEPSIKRNIVTTIATTIGTNIRTDHKSLKPISSRLDPPKEKIIYKYAKVTYY